MQGELATTNHTGDSSTLKWVLIISSAVMGLVVDYFFPGWGRPVLLTVGIFGSLVGFCRAYWSTSFWIVVAGVFALHSALVFRFWVPVNQLSIGVLFFCAVAEIIAIGVILGFVFPDKKQTELQQ